MRYDLSLNSFANDLGLEYKAGQPPFYPPGGRTTPTTSSRGLGSRTSWTIARSSAAGRALYFSDALTIDAFWPKYNTQLLRLQYTNDGRADFAANPLNGQPLPTYDQAQSQLCNSSAQAANFAAWRASNFAGAAPCIINALQEMPAPDEYMQMARNWNSSIGFQRQFGSSLAFEADYVYTKGTNEKDTIPNVNLAYDPATGVNLPFNNANRARLPWPEMGVVSMIPHNTRSELRSLQTAFTKRLSNRWQASATYTLSWFYNAENQPFSGLQIVPFPVQPDLGNEYTLAGDDQRHRAVFNGIWQVGRGFQVSGLHYFGAGIRAATTTAATCGCSVPADRRGCAPMAASSSATATSSRRRTRRTSACSSGFRSAAACRSTCIAEVFNVFNRPNFTETAGEQRELREAAVGQYRTGRLVSD